MTEATHDATTGRRFPDRDENGKPNTGRGKRQRKGPARPTEAEEFKGFAAPLGDGADDQGPSHLPASQGGHNTTDEWRNLWGFTQSIFPRLTRLFDFWASDACSAAMIERATQIARRDNPRLKQWELFRPENGVAGMELERRKTQRNFTMQCLLAGHLPACIRRTFTRGGWEVTAYDERGELRILSPSELAGLQPVIHGNRLEGDGRIFTGVRVRRDSRPTTAQVDFPPSKPANPVRSGPRICDTDAVEKMGHLISTDCMTIPRAAQRVVQLGMAKGSGTDESKAKRLERRYREHQRVSE